MNQGPRGDEAGWREIPPVPETPASDVARLMQDAMRTQSATSHPTDDRCDPAMIAVLRSQSLAEKLATLSVMWRSCGAASKPITRAGSRLPCAPAVCAQTAQRPAIQMVINSQYFDMLLGLIDQIDLDSPA